MTSLLVCLPLSFCSSQSLSVEQCSHCCATDTTHSIHLFHLIQTLSIISSHAHILKRIRRVCVVFHVRDQCQPYGSSFERSTHAIVFLHLS
ncbi:hypothetical protein BJ741DRAFT_618752 [Chytriomyces cf. hyalinus JEL632]|nr:hypothetical protein BJ741DRAFT_618752 [Chytriomyces cf. hyalinus JEL632]